LVEKLPVNDFVKYERDMQMENETAIPDPEDDESAIDGCGVAIEDETADEDLPASEGGVA
jgi:hypothetical protein